MPVIESMLPDMAKLASDAARPIHNMSNRPKRSEALPMRIAPNRVRPERSEVWPPWHSASQPKVSRRVCMNGNVIAAAETDKNDMTDPQCTALLRLTFQPFGRTCGCRADMKRTQGRTQHTATASTLGSKPQPVGSDGAEGSEARN